MKWFKDIHGRQIRLTDEREEHIEADHPEMSGQIDKLRETLRNPDKVIRSFTDPEVELFYKYSLRCYTCYEKVFMCYH